MSRYYAFNRGLLSKTALARVDLKRSALSADTFVNWMPRVLGPMSLRPGLAYVDTVPGASRHLQFTYSLSDQATVELTANTMRVRISDEIVTRASVSSAFTNGTFAVDLTGWTDNDETGCASTWATGGYLSLVGNGDNYAIVDQAVTVDANVEHGVRVVVTRGTVVLRLGSTSGGSEYTDTTLAVGTHSIAVTPTSATLHVRLQASTRYATLVDSIAFDGAGDLSLPTPWGAGDLGNIRFVQSGDVIFVACKGVVQKKIERRSATSWSVVDYVTADGPFRTVNATPVALSASALSGDVTLTASKPLFTSEHVGSLIAIDSQGQSVQRDISGENQYTDYIRVTGTGSSRRFHFTISGMTSGVDDTETVSVTAANMWSGSVIISGTSRLLQIEITGTWDAYITLQSSPDNGATGWTDVVSYTGNKDVDYDDGLISTMYYRIGCKTGGYTSGTADATITKPANSGIVTMQRSVAEPGAWADVSGKEYNRNVTTSYDDGDDNAIYYYRFGVKEGDYVSGTISVSATYAQGSIQGRAQIVSVTNSTTASAIVLKNLGGTSAVLDWYEGYWSPKHGYPSAVEIHSGRLWWAGKDKFFGSVSDNYYSFDLEYEGDAGPIIRSVGRGPVDTISWLLSSQTLLTGAQGSVINVRSSSIDEPITPSNWDLRTACTTGSAAIQAERVDNSNIFVQSGGTRVYELAYDGTIFDYGVKDLTAVVPEIGEPAITRMVVQRHPDTRVHFVRSDGTVAVLVYDRLEEVQCWVELETAGTVEDVFVVPGSIEDTVYYVVSRANGRYLEKFSLASQIRHMDSHIVYSGVSTTSITGLSHLEGETVAVWGDSKDLGTYTVSGGTITLSDAVTFAVVGLPYTAQWRPTKIDSILDRDFKGMHRITRAGLLLYKTHAKGVKYGRDFSNLQNMPLTEKYETVDEDAIHDEYHELDFPFPGTFEVDPRVCLQAESPRPVTVMAVYFDVI